MKTQEQLYITNIIKNILLEEFQQSLSESEMNLKNYDYDAEKTLRILKNQYEKKHNYNLEAEIERNGHIIVISVYDFDENSILELLSIIESVGFFVSSIDTNKGHALPGPYTIIKYSKNTLIELLNNKRKYLDIEIIIEKKFDSHITVERLISNNTIFLYHATDKIKAQKIINNGLSPKNKSKQTTHPERIYFSNNIGDVRDLVKTLKRYDKERIKNLTLSPINYSGRYTILRIDLRKLPIDFSFFVDPNYEISGYYTLNYITKTAITDLKENL